MNYTKDSQFLDVLKSIFPDAYSLSAPGTKLSSRVKSTGVDLRTADFLGRIEDHPDLGTIGDFEKLSLTLTFECSYGKIVVSCKKEEELHFHPLELLELSRGVSALPLVMDIKKRFEASVLYPIVKKEKINAWEIKKSVV